MKKGLMFLFAVLAGMNLMAATLHVDLNSTNPTAPFASRETAATDIQTAVNAAATGDTVQVWDGHYLLASEITVSKAITVQSANGLETTLVDGKGSVRCFNLGNNACVVEGLTITNGYTGNNGGGIYCSGTTPIVTNCIISGNSATYGGGMYYGTANHCTLSGNSATQRGGGMYRGTANNCTISGNSSGGSGGGMYEGTANNCTISGNSGSGMFGARANNCTITGNSGGGMYRGTANNCIVWYNTTGKDLDVTTARYSCSPDVTHGSNGNITNAPVFVSFSHIAADSPCRGAGSADYATGMDIDGEFWANPPSMGCDEPADLPGGPMEVDFISNESMVVSGYPVQFQEQIYGALSQHVWDFDDGTRVTNSFFVEHAWAASGIFNVVLTAYNADWPGGVSATQEISVISFEETAIHVSPNGNDANDGTSWASAKATIQAGVDAQCLIGGGVLVGSGTYSLSSTITVSKPVRIVSLDGPGTTIVDGQGSVRCFSLGNTACVIEGLTITNGYSSGDGGGIYCLDTTPIVTNCTIRGNSASYGGGMYRGTANNCTISGNTAPNGGGMYEGTANNCTISGNSGCGMYGARANNCTITGNSGGGMYRGTANNCIVWYSTTGKDLDGTTASYSCSPDVTHGSNGNITNAPVLVSSSHIAADSPCRGAGSVDYATGTDIDGEAWVNPPSMGCDEPSDDLPRGSINVGFVADELRMIAGYPIQFKGQIHGALSGHVWDFGDGTEITNSLSVEHAWAALGTYDVVLTAYNADWPGGVSATQEVSIVSFEETAIHVSHNGSDANDGTSWASAKATIQAGVDAQDLLGGGVLVGSGTYSLSATITVSKPVRIVGVDGPESTIVDGQGKRRCFNLGDTACVIEGLTITNGNCGFNSGGGIYCSDTTPVVANCFITGNMASYGGGMSGGTANHCTISGNTASSGGGGMSGGTANHCTISGNSGRGMRYGTANHCTITGNSGGGMYYCTANNCTISGNLLSFAGGGMYEGTANNCIISGNSATDSGGGMYYGTANNCTITGNSAPSGGGMYQGTANNCTITGNSANSGGGMKNGAANNCIVWYNTTGKDLDGTTTRYSCSPNVTHGSNGNITNAPILVSSSHIAADSPCRGAGSADYASGTDIDGEAWVNPPSMGCDEPSGDLPRGLVEVDFVANQSMVVTGYPIQFKGQIHGVLSGHVWDFGDGTQITNSLFVEHSWVASGTFDVVLTAYNADWPGGVSATQEVSVVSFEESAIYVSPNGNDENDGTSWASAKETIQAGVDAQDLLDGGVLVGSGTYSLSATITVSEPVRIVGVDGPGSTILDGQGSVRCFNLGNTACVIEGLTITNGYSSGNGGGIYCSGIVPVVTNCTISGNSASYGGGMYGGTANNCTLSGNTATQQGGGMVGGTANHCTISGNSAGGSGGGMYEGTANNCTISVNTSSRYGGGMRGGTANNCTISGNSAEYGGGMSYGTANNCTLTWNSALEDGGGMYYGTAKNCIVYFNTSPSGNDLYDTTARYSCSPDVTHGSNGNITNAPMLVSSSHIAADSPCQGAGSADYAGGTDIDGEAWVNPPSMGCDDPADFPGGAIEVDFLANESMVASGYPIQFQGQIHGALSAHVWDFGDGTRVTNSISVEHTWAALGTYDVVLTAYNSDWPDGVSATQEVSIVYPGDFAIHVSPNGNDANDGTSWESAKASIQAGVDAQFLGGWVLVGSGTYSLSATITVSKPVRIVGVDGPESTIVDGQGNVRCFNLGNTSCVIEGLTIRNGDCGDNSGGGIYCFDTTPVIANCFITGNRASSGGGVYNGTANNCTITGNSASYGGGMYEGTANNCTISGNTASYGGGGMRNGAANNCIVWYNTASSGNNLYDTTASYSCSPDVTHGANGNITNAPMLASSSHIAADSPCRGAGSEDYATGTDIDGEAWVNPPSMGCDEPADFPGGAIEVDFLANESMVASGYPIQFQGQIHGALSAHVWNFGDGTRVTNLISVEHTWAALGTYDVVLTAYNSDWPDGVSATQKVSIVSFEESAIHVSPDGNDANDGMSWASAKATIQAGVDAQNLQDGWVLVERGTYFLSGTIRVTKPVRIVGIDGPGSTIVDGQDRVGGFNLGNIACVIEGLTITNGYSSNDGGGIYCSGIVPVVTNCTISGNYTTDNGGGMYKGTANNCTISGNSSHEYGGGMCYGTANNCTITENRSNYGGGMYYGTANNCTISFNSASSRDGGGMYKGTANNCTIRGNSAKYGGGGMFGCTANNCTISGNTASQYGGGMCSGTANNCIVWYNTSPSGKDLSSTPVSYSCSPDVTHDMDGNITNAPVFVDAANGDYRLAAGSPCIDVGHNGYVVGSLDLAGLPRIVGGVVDMGAYEYYNEDDDEDDDGMPNWWEATHFGSILGSAPTDDFDNDLLDNISEWIAGTDPGDPTSVFAASVSANQASAGFVIEWTSVEDRTYSVLWGRTLTNDYQVLQNGITYPQDSYTDTEHNDESAGFYRVEVRMP